jgi:hypothetical protein
MIATTLIVTIISTNVNPAVARRMLVPEV